MENKTENRLNLGENYTYVWLDIEENKFSRPFTKSDVEKYIDLEDMEKARLANWVLIEYRPLNGINFEFKN